MIPVITIIGRPNVGKSTLFNYLTRSRAALVADQPGVTRDRQYGEGQFEGRPFILIDTGGMEKNNEALQSLMHQQTLTAITEADAVLWLVDAKAGLTSVEDLICKQLRALNKPIYVVVNKTDGLDPQVAAADFYRLGFKQVYPIVASQGKGIQKLMAAVMSEYPSVELSAEDLTEEDIREYPGEEHPVVPENPTVSPIKVAIVGKPNVGKSTLVNRILGEQRVLVFDAPGTTRDSIFIPFERRGREYILIDTAGMRRKRSIEDSSIEQFSVVKTLQAITEANVVIFTIDAREGITDQDAHILGFILDSGRALIIAVNKWDGLAPDERASVERSLDRRLQFVNYARIKHISALHGTGVGELFPLIQEAYASAMSSISTSKLTAILERAVETHQPPAVLGRRIKLRYAHQGGVNPPVIVIHGNQTDDVPASYRRYLANFFREALSLMGTPITIVFKSGDNPYKDKKNVLTDRQKERRKRLIRHVKKG